jgi:hypothetical protein
MAVSWVVSSFDERARWTPQTTPHYRLLVEAVEARRKRRGTGETLIVDHPGIGYGVETPPLFRDAGRPISTTAAPSDEKVGAAVRRGADPWQAMWRAGGQSGAMAWDGPNGVTYGIH